MNTDTIASAEIIPHKYKTQLCRSYLQGQKCHFANKCNYAHGESELYKKTNRAQQEVDMVQPALASPKSACLDWKTKVFKQVLVAQGNNDMSKTPTVSLNNYEIRFGCKSSNDSTSASDHESEDFIEEAERSVPTMYSNLLKSLEATAESLGQDSCAWYEQTI